MPELKKSLGVKTFSMVTVKSVVVGVTIVSPSSSLLQDVAKQPITKIAKKFFRPITVKNHR